MKGGEAAKQANSVGETEKTGDVNWIMMIQQLNDGQAIARGHERFLAKTRTNLKLSVTQSQITRFNLTSDPNPCIRLFSQALQSSLLILDVLITVVRSNSQHSLS